MDHSESTFTSLPSGQTFLNFQQVGKFPLLWSSTCFHFSSLNSRVFIIFLIPSQSCRFHNPTSVWSFSVSLYHYGLVALFFKNEWTLCNSLLGFIFTKYPMNWILHTHIVCDFMDMLADFGIKFKIKCIPTLFLAQRFFPQIFLL